MVKVLGWGLPLFPVLGGVASAPPVSFALFILFYFYFIYLFLFLFYFILKTLSLASKMYLKWYMTLNYENNNNYNNELFTLYKFSEVPI